jgi:hypothetical protein
VFFHSRSEYGSGYSRVPGKQLREYGSGYSRVPAVGANQSLVIQCKSINAYYYSTRINRKWQNRVPDRQIVFWTQVDAYIHVQLYLYRYYTRGCCLGSEVITHAAPSLDTPFCGSSAALAACDRGYYRVVWRIQPPFLAPLVRITLGSMKRSSPHLRSLLQITGLRGALRTSQPSEIMGRAVGARSRSSIAHAQTRSVLSALCTHIPRYMSIVHSRHVCRARLRASPRVVRALRARTRVHLARCPKCAKKLSDFPKCKRALCYCASDDDTAAHLVGDVDRWPTPEGVWLM